MANMNMATAMSKAVGGAATPEQFTAPVILAFRGIQTEDKPAAYVEIQAAAQEHLGITLPGPGLSQMYWLLAGAGAAVLGGLGL